MVDSLQIVFEAIYILFVRRLMIFSIIQTAGELLLDGIGKDDKDSETVAAELFTLGCDRGLPVSCYYLGGLYYKQAMDQRQADVRAAGTVTKVQSSAESSLRKSAIATWIKACDAGHELACRNVARAYRLGDGVNEDTTKAAEYLRRADSDETQAQSTISISVQTYFSSIF